MGGASPGRIGDAKEIEREIAPVSAYCMKVSARQTEGPKETRNDVRHESIRSKLLSSW